MALNINTNIGALGAAAAASSVNKSMETSMERLSTGLRVNTAADDAAGVAIGSRLTAEIRGTNQAIRNAMDGQAMIDTAEGAHNEITNILQRMRELAVQAASDTNNSTDRTNLQAEIDQLTTEINRISSVTSWAGQSLLNGQGGTAGDGTFDFQIGGRTNAADVLSVTINAVDAISLGVSGKAAADTDLFFDDVQDATGAAASAATGNYAETEGTDLITVSDGADAASTVEIFGVTISRTTEIEDFGIVGEANLLATAINENVTLRGLGVQAVSNGDGTISVKVGGNSVASNSAAQATIDNIDAAISTINTQRANLGAISNRLDSTVSNLTNIATNLEAGRSRIMDADFAAESTNLAKAQILQQASTAMLAQANASKQGVLQLLQG